MPTSYGVKKRLYLSHPEPDVAVVRRSVTRFIPPERRPSPPPKIVRPAPLPPPPPPVQKPAPLPPPPPPVVAPPVVAPPVVVLPPPPPPPPPPQPKPEKIEIDVISVDVDPPTPRRKRSRSRSKRRSPRESRELERVIERDHFIPVPYPVEVEPQYDTFRYVEGPRRYEHSPSPSPPPRRAIEEDTRIRISDRERFRERW